MTLSLFGIEGDLQKPSHFSILPLDDGAHMHGLSHKKKQLELKYFVCWI